LRDAGGVGGLWRRRRGGGLTEDTLGAGVVLHGPLWVGDGTEHEDGRVVVGADGVVTAVGPAGTVEIPFGCLEVDAGWVGPGLYDAHVHLALSGVGATGDLAPYLRTGVVAVRDLGAPPLDAIGWRATSGPRVTVAGPLLTAPGGYPSTTWGSAGFAAFVDDPEQAARLVAGLCATADVVKLALEPRAGPVPAPEVCTAVVDAAHAGGRPVTCHALSADMVERALDAGVDELAHTPTEPLPAEMVDRVVDAGVPVVSTLHTFAAGGEGAGAVGNAAALVAAGATLRYGTDLGNAGIKPGADLTELRLLAGDVGLGPDAALQAATEPLRVGEVAGVVALDNDPRQDPRAWLHPRAVISGTTLLLRP
jgi:imidazolonepropionase-like amidohydrolase